MKRADVERVAEQMATLCARHPDSHGAWKALAAWHLREVRRAERRARGIGYTAVTSAKPLLLCCQSVHTTRAGVEAYVSPGGFRLARVVLLPKRKEARRV